MTKDAKLNMLVFWASWCGPCRKEIPALKGIEKSYRGKGLNLVNISIDESKQDWETALKQEQMAWPQFLVDSASRSLTLSQYNVAGVPLVIFTDGSGNEINRFTGYDEEQVKKYEGVIKKFILN